MKSQDLRRTRKEEKNVAADAMAILSRMRRLAQVLFELVEALHWLLHAVHPVEVQW